MKKLLFVLAVLGLGLVAGNCYAGDAYCAAALLAPTTAYTGSNWCTGVYICNNSTTAITIIIRDSNTIRARIYTDASSGNNVDFAGQGHLTNSTSTVYLFDKNETDVHATIFYRER